ncbi:MAG: endonuclease/exonuclease/phosphatase family protein [Pseudomonadota bacterium]
MRRIGTYNVQNLFLTDDGPRKPGREVSALAQTIDRLDATVLMVQEIGSRTSLNRLNRRLRRPYSAVGLIEGNSDRSIHLGVLSRQPFVLKSHRDWPVAVTTDGGATEWRRFQRDVLQCDLPGKLTLFGVHLKSQASAPAPLTADAIRLAEARALRDIVVRYQRNHPDRALMLLGDVNDRLDADSLAPIAALPWFDPIGEAARIARRHPTTYWPKRRMRIDVILTSPNARNRVVHGRSIIHREVRARRASDHYPVTVDFDG